MSKPRKWLSYIIQTPYEKKMEIIAREALTKLVLAVYIPDEKRRKKKRILLVAFPKIRYTPEMKMASLREHKNARRTRIA